MTTRFVNVSVRYKRTLCERDKKIMGRFKEVKGGQGEGEEMMEYTPFTKKGTKENRNSPVETTT